MKLPEKVYHAWFEDGHVKYYKDRAAYDNGNYTKIELPKWLGSLVRKEFKSERKEGRNDLRTSINNLLRFE
jgi:hypothetical protein